MHAKTIRIAAFASLAALLGLAYLTDTAIAGKDHCRTLMLEGSAGDTSTDSVTFRVVDENGGTVIDESCQVTVKSGELSHQLGERLPVQWYYNDPDDPVATPPCPTDAEALAIATKPNGKVKYPKKVCSESSGGSGPSCRIKFTYKVKKSTGEVKKGPQLEVCCYEGAGCKGSKWGSTTDNPVNLQVRNNSVAIDFLPAPASLPAAVGAASDLVVDPIGLEQLPPPEVSGCRAVIAKDIEKLANLMAKVLRTCHADPEVPDQSVCNSISPASDPSGNVSTAATSLRQQVRDACASLGAPSKFSYAACPAPCGGFITPPTCVGGPNDGAVCRKDSECDSGRYCVDDAAPPCMTNSDCLLTGGGNCVEPGVCLHGCTTFVDCDGLPGEGKCVPKGDGVCKDRCAVPPLNAGNPCSVDTDCDSAPSSGDGRCGDWGEVADCAACLTRAAVENSFLQAFGPSGSSIGLLNPEDVKCKDAVAAGMGKLQQVQLKETRSCQKRLDAAKTALPATAKKCKDADLKGKRAKAVAAYQSFIVGKACLPPIALDGCGGGDPSLLAQCTTEAIRTVNQAYGISAIPDSRCGDAKRIGEECDDGNLLNGDGCADDCTCEGTCGDGLLNPLAVCGEICDDGNPTDGDGCDSNCTPTGCGNGILTPPEQCEADADCPSGSCQADCTCVP
jgi:cysteine-rich repeat protein